MSGLDICILVRCLLLAHVLALTTRAKAFHVYFTAIPRYFNIFFKVFFRSVHFGISFAPHEELLILESKIIRREFTLVFLCIFASLVRLYGLSGVSPHGEGGSHEGDNRFCVSYCMCE